MVGVERTKLGDNRVRTERGHWKMATVFHLACHDVTGPGALTPFTIAVFCLFLKMTAFAILFLWFL